MKKYFTLIEMIVVIVIVGILAGIVIPNIKDFQKESLTSMIHSNIRILQTAVDSYSLKHDGSYPADIQPAFEKPQAINVDLLYPDYIKSKPYYDKLKEQKYWVDSEGKVWGATVDSPSNLIKSSTSLEWKHDHNVVEYNLYEATTHTVTGAAENSSVRLKARLKVDSDVDRLKVPYSSDKHYLISSVDDYGLESAPVGLNHDGYQDWFHPILQKEGVFTFEINSDEIMYWENFRTVENKPEGTQISYRFAVTDDGVNVNGAAVHNLTYSELTSDFASLQPAKNIKIEITTKGYNGKYPTIEDMRIYYHFAYDNVKIVPSFQRTQIENLAENGQAVNPELPVKVSDEFLANEKIEDIKVVDSYGTSTVQEVSYSYKPPAQDLFIPVSSLGEIPVGSTVRITRTYDKGSDLFIGNPIVTTKSEVNTKSVTPEELTVGNAEAPEWTTLYTQNFFATTGDNQRTHWLKVEPDDVEPENTRILYTYQATNGKGWSSEVDDILKVPDSETLKISATFQVRTAVKDSIEEYATLNGIKVTHERGVLDVGMVKPTGVIIPKKDNNPNSVAFSVDSKITWEYEAADPRGKEITKVEWGGDKREQYTTPGKYTVTLKLTNSSNYTSDLITYVLDVKPEKPVAVISSPSNLVFKGQKVKWDSSQSNDPDGDGFKEIQWTGEKQDIYSQTGTYNVSLRVQDNDGYWSDPVSLAITVVEMQNFDEVYQANAYLYVDALKGSDTTGDGSESKPFATIQKAISNVKVDKTQISIASGTYNEQMVNVPGTYGNRENALLRSTPNLDYALIGDPNDLPVIYLTGTGAEWSSNPIVQLGGSTVTKSHIYEMRNLRIVPTASSKPILFFSDLTVKYPAQVNISNVHLQDPSKKVSYLFYLNGGAYGTSKVTMNILNSNLNGTGLVYRNGNNDVFIYNSAILGQFKSYQHIY